MTKTDHFSNKDLYIQQRNSHYHWLPPDFWVIPENASSNGIKLDKEKNIFFSCFQTFTKYQRDGEERRSDGKSDG